MAQFSWIEHAAGLVQEFRTSLAVDFVTRDEYTRNNHMVAQVVTDVQNAVVKLKKDVADRLAVIAGSTLDPDTALALQGVVNDLNALDSQVLSAGGGSPTGATGVEAPPAS